MKRIEQFEIVGNVFDRVATSDFDVGMQTMLHDLNRLGYRAKFVLDDDGVVRIERVWEANGSGIWERAMQIAGFR